MVAHSLVYAQDAISQYCKIHKEIGSKILERKAQTMQLAIKPPKSIIKCAVEAFVRKAQEKREKERQLIRKDKGK